MVSTGMNTARKITVEMPSELLEKAQKATKAGGQTFHAGLQMLAAPQVYERLRGYKGKVQFSRTADKLKMDR